LVFNFTPQRNSYRQSQRKTAKTALGIRRIFTGQITKRTAIQDIRHCGKNPLFSPNSQKRGIRHYRSFRAKSQILRKTRNKAFRRFTARMPNADPPRLGRGIGRAATRTGRRTRHSVTGRRSPRREQERETRITPGTGKTPGNEENAYAVP
jgi:hypothetical protein